MGASALPPNIRLTLTDRALSSESGGAIVSTALLCPDRTFESFGIRGPHLSPDQHWILVGVRGPYAPGNVARNHALVQVRSGRIVFSPSFPAVLGIPSTSEGLSWASGEPEMLRYSDGRTVSLRDPPARPLPPQRCTAHNASAARRAAAATPAVVTVRA